MDRVLLTLATLAFAAGVALLMLRGWRRRQRRQGDLPPPPPVPDDAGRVLVGATPGLFVGTTTEGEWLDRIAVHGLSDRAAGWVTVTDRGVVVEREGLADLWLPHDLLLDAGLGDAIAGKVVGRDGLLLLTWRLGSRTVESGFRADDHAQNRRLADAVRSSIPVPDGTAPTTEETP